jgi:uncharacterized membrane protein YhhN
MEQILSIYAQFLSFFPSNIHGLVSFFLAVILVIAIFKVIKKNFIYIILLIILLPASIPILKSVWEGVVNLIDFLLTKK